MCYDGYRSTVRSFAVVWVLNNYGTGNCSDAGHFTGFITGFWRKSMSIRMIGIDYQSADVDIRAKFSFTQKNTAEALNRLTEMPDIFGAVILSTCNRMELWISVDDEWKGSMLELLCDLKGLSSEDYIPLFYRKKRDRSGETSVLSDLWIKIHDTCGRPVSCLRSRMLFVWPGRITVQTMFWKYCF